MKIILGSQSPRRKELLELLGYEFTVISPNVDETVEYTTFPEMVQKIAFKKAHHISQTYKDELIICADTIVVCEDECFGKPKSKEDAYYMIKALSGKPHSVYTAVACIYQGKEYGFVEETKCYVTDMTEEEILDYISTSEPYDKAGAYGIQGIFAKYIEKIDGDYYNVMGLPICHLNKLINKIKSSRN